MDARIFLRFVNLLLNSKQRKCRMLDSQTIIKMMILAERRRRAA